MRRAMLFVVALVLVLVAVAARPQPAAAGWQCQQAANAGWRSPSQNIQCAYEWLFSLM